MAEGSAEMFDKIVDVMEKMDLWNYLNDPTDPDTCSIGGSHMMNIYNKALDAGDVFNNQLATVPSLGFKLRYDE